MPRSKLGIADAQPSRPVRAVGGGVGAAATPRGDDEILVEVLLQLPVERSYPYRLPVPLTDSEGDSEGKSGADTAGVPAKAPPPGTWVEARAGGRRCFGVVWDGPIVAPSVAPSAPSVAGAGGKPRKAPQPRPLERILDAPPMSAELRIFLLWSARYTMNPPGAMLRAAAPVDAALLPPSARARARATGDTRPPTTDGDATDGDDAPTTASAGVVLEPQQATAATALCARLGAGFSVSLLEGVTGSGKSETYLEAVRAATQGAGQALVLVPEIALSTDWRARMAKRLGFAPILWHSEITPARRRETWRACADGSARVVVGARSALFLPLPNLALIVVDEEHDTAYKQEDRISYHARDLSVARAHAAAVPVVLVSATPSLETLVNVERKRYTRVHLPERFRADGAVGELPTVRAVDLRVDRPVPPPASREAWLAPPLVAALEQTFAHGEQALLFLNRRGFAPMLLCDACGYRITCPDCTAWMVLHGARASAAGFGGRLHCHHCGFAMGVPPACPACDCPGEGVPREPDPPPANGVSATATEKGEKKDAPAKAARLVGGWRACGPGVERVAEEVRLRFPNARLLVASSDTMSGPKALRAVFDAVRAREIDVLVGTQIVGKGHHFPHMTCVGIVDADVGLAGGDLRALEKTWAVLHQVAGRAGRNRYAGGAGAVAGAPAGGLVLVQTRLPEHPVMEALVSGDATAFLAHEKEARRRASMPPFGRLAAFVLSSEDERALDDYAHRLAAAAPQVKGLRVLGPAPAPLAILRRRHRRRFLLQAAPGLRLQDHIRPWVARVPRPARVRLAVDIDPYSFL